VFNWADFEGPTRFRQYPLDINEFKCLYDETQRLLYFRQLDGSSWMDCSVQNELQRLLDTVSTECSGVTLRVSALSPPTASLRYTYSETAFLEIPVS
jgi:hypothetical protein